MVFFLLLHQMIFSLEKIINIKSSSNKKHQEARTQFHFFIKQKPQTI